MSNSNVSCFKSLVEPHLDALFRAAFMLVRNQADAQDLVQETCVRAYQRISELDESCHVKGWLLRVLHNVFVDDARRARRSPVMSFGEPAAPVSLSPCSDPNPEEATYGRQREEQLKRALSRPHWNKHKRVIPRKWYARLPNVHCRPTKKSTSAPCRSCSTSATGSRNPTDVWAAGISLRDPAETNHQYRCKQPRKLA